MPLPPAERPSLLSAILGFTRPKPQGGFPRRFIPSNERKNPIAGRRDFSGRNPGIERRRWRNVCNEKKLNFLLQKSPIPQTQT